MEVPDRKRYSYRWFNPQDFLDVGDPAEVPPAIQIRVTVPDNQLDRTRITYVLERAAQEMITHILSDTDGSPDE